MLEVEDPVEPGAERRVVGCGAGSHPDVVSLRGDMRDLRCELCGNTRRLLPVASRDADQASVDILVRKRLLQRAQLVEQASDLVTREELVLQRLERGQVVGAGLRPARGHGHLLVPLEDTARGLKIGDLGESGLELGKGVGQRGSSLGTIEI